MNQRIEYALSSEFGPPSQPIDLRKFAEDAAALSHSVPNVVDRDLIAEECSVQDIQSSLMGVWNNPVLSAYLYSSHNKAIASLHATKSSKLAKTLKKATIVSEPYNELQEVKKLEKELNVIPLSSWKLMPDSAIFTRSPRNSDFNALTIVKTSGSNMDTPPDSNDSQILIVASIHSKVHWRTSVLNRTSQHVLKASQTLGELFEVIPCVSNELPEEVMENEQVIGYKDVEMGGSSGCVIVIDNLAYGDGLNEEDYADKLVQHLKVTNSFSQITKAETTMHDTPLSSLKLQINAPYWLLHQGNCEHFIVIDEIRLKHSKDPTSGYPLTVHQAPASLDWCQACTKTPAVWSVVGDVRLEASPCLLCDPCWENMDGSSNVIVVPLPKYKLW